MIAFGFYNYFSATIASEEKEKLGFLRFLFCFLYLGIPFFVNAIMAVLGSKSLKTGLITVSIAVLMGFAYGVCEEIVFRGVVYNKLHSLLRSYKESYLVSAFISSLVFALLHFTNLFTQPMAGTVMQVYYAFAAGMCFCGIYLFSGRLLIPVLLHCIVDICHMLPAIDGSVATSNINWMSILFSSILLAEGIILVAIYQKKHGTKSNE